MITKSNEFLYLHLLKGQQTGRKVPEREGTAKCLLWTDLESSRTLYF